VPAEREVVGHGEGSATHQDGSHLARRHGTVELVKSTRSTPLQAQRQLDRRAVRNVHEHLAPLTLLRHGYWGHGSTPQRILKLDKRTIARRIRARVNVHRGQSGANRRRRTASELAVDREVLHGYPTRASEAR
jgi:hypothetical protein